MLKQPFFLVAYMRNRHAEPHLKNILHGTLTSYNLDTIAIFSDRSDHLLPKTFFKSSLSDALSFIYD